MHCALNDHAHISTFLGWPCLANTPIRESQSLNKNIITGKFDFTVDFSAYLAFTSGSCMDGLSKLTGNDRVEEIMENQNLC